jgi:hypothetical protein
MRPFRPVSQFKYLSRATMPILLGSPIGQAKIASDPKAYQDRANRHAAFAVRTDAGQSRILPVDDGQNYRKNYRNDFADRNDDALRGAKY